MATDTDDGYENVVVPRGTFVGWGKKPGQKMTAKVIAYGDTDGTDANGNICPQVVAELIEPFTNYRDGGDTVEELEAGELVTINASQANLKRNVKAAALEPGFKFRLTFADTAKSANGTVKLFELAVNRTRPQGVAADSIV